MLSKSIPSKMHIPSCKPPIIFSLISSEGPTCIKIHLLTTGPLTLSIVCNFTFVVIAEFRYSTRFRGNATHTPLFSSNSPLRVSCKTLELTLYVQAYSILAKKKRKKKSIKGPEISPLVNYLLHQPINSIWRSSSRYLLVELYHAWWQHLITYRWIPRPIHAKK